MARRQQVSSPRAVVARAAARAALCMVRSPNAIDRASSRLIVAGPEGVSGGAWRAACAKRCTNRHRGMLRWSCPPWRQVARLPPPVGVEAVKKPQEAAPESVLIAQDRWVRLTWGSALCKQLVPSVVGGILRKTGGAVFSPRFTPSQTGGFLFP